MRKPEFLAFAGLDDRTDLDRVHELSCRYPLEWGWLWSLGRDGDPRYPSSMIIDRLKMYEGEVSFAIHLCGNEARRFNQGEMLPNLRIFDRIQVNLNDDIYDPHQLDLWADILDKPIIQQWRQIEFPEARGPLRHFLYDVSGGRGKMPDALPVATEGYLVGFAGGITPENAVYFNSMVQGDNPYYLDMESGIRTDNWLDLDKCEAVCKAIYGDQEYPQ